MPLTQPDAQGSCVENALRRSEERYRALYDGTPSMYFTVDPDGKVMSVNQFGATYLGYAPEELVGRSVLQVFVKEDRQAAADHVAHCLAHPGQVFHWELRKIRKDGSRLWVKETARAVHEPDGTASVMIVCEDITERKRVEEALRQEQERFRYVAMATRDAVYDWDIRTGNVTRNEAYRALFAPNGSVGTNISWWERQLHPEDRQRVLDSLDETFRHRRSYWSEEYRFLRLDGTYAVVIDRGFVVYDVRGEPIRMIGAISDITERKQSEQALRASEERYRALYHDTPSMYFTVDPNGTVLSVNHYGATYLGYQAEELIGQSVLGVFADVDKDAATAQVHKCLADPGRVFNWELRKVRKDGSLLWVRETARAVSSPDGGLAVMIVCEDITERKRAEEAVHLRNRAIESTHNAIIIAKCSAAEDNPIIYVNPAFERITGYGAAEVVGHNPRLLIGNDWHQPEIERLRQAVRDASEVRVVLRNYRKDGTLFWNELWFAPVRDEAGTPTHFISVINDVTDRMRYQQELEYQANYDFLTGLANRNLLRDRLNQTLAQAHRFQWTVALIFIDLDHFKVINDSMGHNAGDTLVRAVAQRLQGCVREVDTVARLGGDEFVVVLPDAKKEDEVTGTMQRIQQALAPPFTIDGRELYVNCSMGAAIYPRDGVDGETLLKNADMAMYRAKEMGRNTFQYYRADMNVKVNERLSMESNLRRALEKDELRLQFQPIIETATGKIVGAEALLRWQHPQEGLVRPARFIPVAEETGLIIPIGQWVVEQACRQARLWHDQGLLSFGIAVNLSAHQFRQPNLADVVARALAANHLDPQLLHLELTESMVMQQIEEAIVMARRLKSLGLSLSLDDFGTGHSSLNYLKRFPIDTIKIDQSFVHDITSEPDNAAIASAVIAMARSLEIAVVAEGVEAQEQYTFLDGKHCDQIQGYYISPPLEVADFERFLRTWPKASAA